MSNIKKISFKLDIVYHTRIVRVSVSDTYQTRDMPFMIRIRHGTTQFEKTNSRCTLALVQDTYQKTLHAVNLPQLHQLASVTDSLE